MFKACEFDIKDKYDKTIKGVFVYWHRPYKEGDEILQQQLAKVLESDGSTTFDLLFEALSEDYRTKKTHIPRGKKLLVKDIYNRSGEKSKESIFIPSNSLIPSLIS